MKSYVTYEYWNPLTNVVFYVGAGLRRRTKWHIWESRKVINGSASMGNKHKTNTIIKLLKQGVIPLVKVVLEAGREEVFQREIELIKQYGRADQGLGTLTNLTDGGYEGNHGMKMSLETRRRLSEMRRGSNNNFYGRHHSEQNKKEQSRLRAAQYLGSGNPFYGKRHSEKSKTKIADSRIRGIRNGGIIPARHTEAHKEKLSLLYKGESNPASREYVVVDPHGNKTLIKCLKSWCEQNGFSRHTFNGILKRGQSPNRGPAKGWFITAIGVDRCVYAKLLPEEDSASEDGTDRSQVG